MADVMQQAQPSSVIKKKTVATKHKEYSRMAARWKRCRDVAAGQDAVQEGGTAYLPMLKDQEQSEYQAYLKRPAFYNATWRTINGLTGMLFRKPELKKIPGGIEKMMEDVTMAGEPLHAFAQQLAEECYTVGRAGLLVDYPQRDPAMLVTVAGAEAMGLRPMLQRYTAESIINWKHKRVNNVLQLTLAVLEEEFQLPTADEFEQPCEKRYRVLDLPLIEENGKQQYAYRMRVFRINERTDSQEQVGPDYFPMMNGKRIPYIPFYIFGIDNVTPAVEVPPLIDIVDVNLAHFRVSADYEHGCHFTGLPTPVVSGYNPTDPNTKLYVGSTKAWVFPDPAAHASYLEFTGAGLAALERNMAMKEQQMATIGARLLSNEPRANQTATGAAIEHGGETSILSAIAQTLSLVLTKALRVFAEWAGVSGEVSYEINRDFFPVPMDSATLTGLVSAWQSGAISDETLFDNLQAGEIIKPERTFEEESAKIANSAPAKAAAEAQALELKAEPVAA